MICPACQTPDQSEVTDTRPKPWGVWRRRRCLKCDVVWTTEERAAEAKPRGWQRGAWRAEWLDELSSPAGVDYLAARFSVPRKTAESRVRTLAAEGLIEVWGVSPPRLGRSANLWRVTCLQS